MAIDFSGADWTVGHLGADRRPEDSARLARIMFSVSDQFSVSIGQIRQLIGQNLQNEHTIM